MPKTSRTICRPRRAAPPMASATLAETLTVADSVWVKTVPETGTFVGTSEVARFTTADTVFAVRRWIVAEALTTAETTLFVRRESVPLTLTVAVRGFLVCRVIDALVETVDESTMILILICWSTALSETFAEGDLSTVFASEGDSVTLAERPLAVWRPMLGDAVTVAERPLFTRRWSEADS